MNKFIEMSKYAGMREDLVQAGGGNSSYKIKPDRMAIKASGFQLADIKEDVGYAIVNPEIISNAFLLSKNIDSMTEEDSKAILKEAFIEGARPSIETFLHSISGKYTLHTHPIVINVLTCRKGGMNVLHEMFPEALIVPYATPGVELAKMYFKKFKEYGKKVQIVFLQNHGLLVSAETAEDVMNMTDMVVQKIEEYLDVDYSGYHQVTRLYGMLGKGIVWRVTDQNVLRMYRTSGSMWDNAFCPDCIVFLGKKVYVVNGELDKNDLEQFKQLYGEPVIIAYKDDLYINAESVKKALEIQSVLSFSAQVMELNHGYECNLLSDQEQNFLLNWDAEKYRKKIK